MDHPKMNDHKFRDLRIKELIQEVRIVAVCEENFPEEVDDQVVTETRTIELIVDSSRRRIPVPYTEAD